MFCFSFIIQLILNFKFHPRILIWQYQIWIIITIFFFICNDFVYTFVSPCILRKFLLYHFFFCFEESKCGSKSYEIRENSNLNIWPCRSIVLWCGFQVITSNHVRNPLPFNAYHSWNKKVSAWLEASLWH